jgi:hypothetical protein
MTINDRLLALARCAPFCLHVKIGVGVEPFVATGRDSGGRAFFKIGHDLESVVEQCEKVIAPRKAWRRNPGDGQK